jgi:hypothetical protein
MMLSSVPPFAPHLHCEWKVPNQQTSNNPATESLMFSEQL